MMDETLTERPVASIRELALQTGIDPEDVADVLYGGSHLMDDKEAIETHLGHSMEDTRIYVGPDDSARTGREGIGYRNTRVEVPNWVAKKMLKWAEDEYEDANTKSAEISWSKLITQIENSFEAQE